MTVTEEKIFEQLDRGARSLRAVGGQLEVSGEWVRRLVLKMDPEKRARVRSRLEENRGTRRLAALGECKTLREWAYDRRCRVDFQTLVGRLKTGWDWEEAVTTPRLRPGESRPSRRPAPIPAAAGELLRELSELARLVRGRTPVDDPRREAARERNFLVRELVESGHDCREIAAVVGVSVSAVRVWLSYTGWREWKTGA